MEFDLKLSEEMIRQLEKLTPEEWKWLEAYVSDKMNAKCKQLIMGTRMDPSATTIEAIQGLLNSPPSSEK